MGSRLVVKRLQFTYYNPILERDQRIQGTFLESFGSDDPRFMIENYTVDGVPEKGRMIFRIKQVKSIMSDSRVDLVC